MDNNKNASLRRYRDAYSHIPDSVGGTARRKGREG